MRFGYWCCWTFCQLGCGAFFRLRAFGRDRVPVRGPAILAVNHASYLDPVLAGTILPREVTFLARDTLFKVPVFGRLIRYLNAIPIRREGMGVEGLRRALAALAAGRLLLVFPEGTRTRDGRPGTVKPGLESLVRRSGAPIVPVRIAGAFRAWPRRHPFPRPSEIRVFYGRPIPAGEASGGDLAARLRRAWETLPESFPYG